MRQSQQGRRSSNTLPVRPAATGTKLASSTTNLAASGITSAQKRSSSIPRPSFSSAASAAKQPYGQRNDQSLALGMTPSKGGANLRFSAATPSSQMGGTTPQSRGNMSMTATSKPYLKETRNLSDKNCVLEMTKNVATSLSDFGFPECVTHKEIQKIEKQSFIKYFNFIYQFIDGNYQLTPGRFNEDELIRNMKEIGYCGTLAKSALVSIGALHSTSQIVGLLSWLCDMVRMLMSEPDDDSFEKRELDIMMRAYKAWCRDQPYPLSEEFRTLYMEKHGIEENRAEMIDRQLQAIIQEQETLKRKSSQIEELKEEAEKEKLKLEAISAKELELQERSKELQNEERHLLQRFEQIKEKTLISQKETADLLIAAKNCKISADEARRIKSAIAANKRDYEAISEQRNQVAKLVEKRELQLANIGAEETKLDRELNIELMDMGMRIAPGQDPKETLKTFLDSKIKTLSDIESRCIDMTESKERTLVEISQLKMELKHNELRKCRLEEKLALLKSDRDELERLYLSELAQLESISAAPRSDPLLMRKKYDLDTLKQKLGEQNALILQQEQEIETVIRKYKQELENGEAKCAAMEAYSCNYYALLADRSKQLMEAYQNGTLTEELIDALIPPEPDYDQFEYP